MSESSTVPKEPIKREIKDPTEPESYLDTRRPACTRGQLVFLWKPTLRLGLGKARLVAVESQWVLCGDTSSSCTSSKELRFLSTTMSRLNGHGEVFPLGSESAHR